MSYLYGSICLSDIDKKQIRKVKLRNGEEKLYLNINIVERKQPSQYGHTHFISCQPKREEREEGKNYIIGDLKVGGVSYAPPTEEDIAAAPSMGEDEALPF